MTVRLWHDDVRPAPDDSWTWVRTNDAAIAVLSARPVAEISLDHDLGYGAIPGLEETGAQLVRWMIANGKVPPKVTVHSWNPDGARRMAGYLRDAGHAVTVEPYDIRAFSRPTQAQVESAFR